MASWLWAKLTHERRKSSRSYKFLFERSCLVGMIFPLAGCLDDHLINIRYFFAYIFVKWSIDMPETDGALQDAKLVSWSVDHLTLSETDGALQKNSELTQKAFPPFPILWGCFGGVRGVFCWGYVRSLFVSRFSWLFRGIFLCFSFLSWEFG